MQINLRKQFTFLLLLLTSAHLVNAQCGLTPISLSNRVQNASLIIEARVIDIYTAKDDLGRNIYTIANLEIIKTFKGNTALTNVQVIAEGGQFGNQLEIVSSSQSFKTGNTGIFTLIPTNDPFAPSNNFYECYAGPQGFIHYDKEAQSAHEPFNDYNSVAQTLYTALNNSGASILSVKKALNWNQVVDYDEAHDHNQGLNISQSSNAQSAGTSNGNPAVAAVSAGGAITSFSPTTINAGTFTLLTINGSGFGATQGTSFVGFSNPDNGGSSYSTVTTTNNYVSWSDTKIEVYVPTKAGTGNFIVSDGTNTLTSPTPITVPYAVTTVSNSGISYNIKMISDNGNGGYTFQYGNQSIGGANFSTNVPAVTDFEATLNSWKCKVGVNWLVTGTTTIAAIADDGTNIIRFDNGAELPAGVLGRATSRYSGCFTTSGAIEWYVKELDVAFDDGATSSPIVVWHYGAGAIPFSNYDFYSVSLHELGHALQLNHVINSTNVMHYALSNGSQSRNLSVSDSLGGEYELNYSINNTLATCVIGAKHVEYACIPIVNVTTAGPASISEAGASYTITVTSSGVNDNPVTVNFAFSGSANNPADFTAPTSVTIPAGSTSATFVVNVIDDGIVDPAEVITIDVASVTNGVENGTQTTSTTIIDNDFAIPTVTLSSSSNNIVEANGVATITATLSNIYNLPVTINLVTSGTATNTTDYTLSGTTITIPAGSITGTRVVTAVQDNLFEGDEIVTVAIASLANATSSGNQAQNITIIDDDIQPNISSITSANSVNENDSVIVTVNLSNPSTQEIKIPIVMSGTATKGIDYSVPDTLVIPAGSTSGTFKVKSIDDNVYEQNETATVSAGTPINATNNNGATNLITLVDNETAPVITMSSTISTIQETGGQATITLNLDKPSATPLIVTLNVSGTASNGVDYTFTNTYTFNPGTTSLSNILIASADATLESLENVTITIATPIATEAVVSGSQQPITISIVNNFPLSNDIIILSGKLLSNGINQLSWTHELVDMPGIYVVEKSKDANSAYATIAQVNGIVNSSATAQYSLEDANTFLGSNYYRIKFYDLSNTLVKVSNTINLNATSKESLVIYPNPATDKLTINYQHSKQDQVNISLFDLTGKLVNTLSKEVNAGTNIIYLSIESLPKGVYTIKISNVDGTRVVTQQFVTK